MRRRAYQPIRLTSVRPLVRYVDEDQAVIDIQLTLADPWASEGDADQPRDLQAVVEVDSSDGFHDEDTLPIQRRGDSASHRFELVRPQLWWPACMDGKQALYDVSVKLLVDGRFTDENAATIGLNSVRRATVDATGTLKDTLFINGRECPIRCVTSIDLKDEDGLLPIGGDALVIVRGHWGPDVLYDAADRAGLMLIQCVPIHPEGRFEVDVVQAVDRLVRHPSLVGWYVGHLGAIRERMAYCLRSLDPTRQVFRDVPAA